MIPKLRKDLRFLCIRSKMHETDLYHLCVISNKKMCVFFLFFLCAYFSVRISKEACVFCNSGSLWLGCLLYNKKRSTLKRACLDPSVDCLHFAQLIVSTEGGRIKFATALVALIICADSVQLMLCCFASDGLYDLNWSPCCSEAPPISSI